MEGAVASGIRPDVECGLQPREFGMRVEYSIQIQVALKIGRPLPVGLEARLHGSQDGRRHIGG